MHTMGPWPRTIEQIHPVFADEILQVFNGSNPWPLFMTGPVGTGKSCAAMAFVDHLMVSRRYSKSSQYVSDVMKASKGKLVRGTYTHSEESYKQYWADSVITVIDEMGNAEKQSDWPLEILQDLIESRENKASIWISNLSIDDISSIYGNRIASRLSSGTTITFGGKDRRMGG